MRRTVFVLAVLFVALIACAPTQQTVGQEKSRRGKEGGDAKVAADEKTGIAIGEKAPAIKLVDQTGKERLLDELLHEGTVAVVFHRSANW